MTVATTRHTATAGTPSPTDSRSARSAGTVSRILRERWMYLFIVPGVAYFVIFQYVPLFGNLVAFKNYSPFLGFNASPWVGLQNFTDLFSDPEFLTALKNTALISLMQILFAFPAPIALALMLNSLISEKAKRLVQSVVYLPHFFGWVIVISIWQAVLGGVGPMASLLNSLGHGHENVMADPHTFLALVTAQVVWKEVGWGTIIFFAAISAIPVERYEAAAVDGANSFRRMWHVTLPGISNVIVLLLILRLGTVLSVGFEQLLLQQDAVGSGAAEVLDTFGYYRGVIGGQWGLATAAGLFKGVIGTVLVISANRIAKRTGSGGLF
ncbi:ABC transporter permease subunit [Rugosimonospora acidiphila]|uniref:ABC transporter permease subunit n=1 Tax=Rugosimonospora acidiphila TaxID=556531 RepID=A0ABP9RWK2_9ACTN